MKQEFEDAGRRPHQLGSTPKSNGRTASDGPKNGHTNGRKNGEKKNGQLIHFADLARDANAQTEIEKSLREVALQINQTQQAERLQINARLHDVLDRSLALLKPDPAKLEPTAPKSCARAEHANRNEHFSAPDRETA